MMLAFRRLLGKVQSRLERRVATLSSAAGGARHAPEVEISPAGRALLLDWVAGDIDDRGFIVKAGQLNEGQAILEKASISRPANALVWAARAENCLGLGNLSAALEFAERAYASGQILPKVGLLWVRVLVAAGRGEEALSLIPASLESARHMQDFATRVELCRQWQTLEPESVEPQIESTRALTATGDLGAAIKAYERLLEAHGPRIDVLLPLAAIYQDLVRNVEAQRVYLQALDLEPDNVDALCMAGHCARALHDTSLADRCLSRAFELDPGSPFTQYNLGLLRFDQGRLEDAVRLLRGGRAANRGEAWRAEELMARLSKDVERDIADPDWATAPSKLAHDIEQFEYLRARNLLGPVIEQVIAEYRTALDDRLLSDDARMMAALNPKRYPLISRDRPNERLPRTAGPGRAKHKTTPGRPRRR